MSKPGIVIEIPGFGSRTIHVVVSDYTGTLALGGKLVPGAREKLLELQKVVDVHVVTSDSFGQAQQELEGILTPHILRAERHDVEKLEYVNQFDLQHVAALGNGNNDRLLLSRVKGAGGLALAVDNGEGCAIDALINSHLLIVGAANALNLLLEPTGCKATLRF